MLKRGRTKVALRKACSVIAAAILLAVSVHARKASGEPRAAMDNDSVRCEIEGDEARFSASVQRKDAAALAAWVRDITTDDLQVKGPTGALLRLPDVTVPVSERRGPILPVTRKLLLQDLPLLEGEFIKSYAVQNARVTVDKMVVFGDTALVLTTGQGAGVLNDEEAQNDHSRQPHWSSLKYRDCETWVKTPGGWKLQEVYLLAYLPDYWRLHELTEKYLRPFLGF